MTSCSLLACSCQLSSHSSGLVLPRPSLRICRGCISLAALHIAFGPESIVDTVLLVLLHRMTALSMRRAAMRRIRGGVDGVESGLEGVWGSCSVEAHGGRSDRGREREPCEERLTCWSGLLGRISIGIASGGAISDGCPDVCLKRLGHFQHLQQPFT